MGGDNVLLELRAMIERIKKRLDDHNKILEKKPEEGVVVRLTKQEVTLRKRKELGCWKRSAILGRVFALSKEEAKASSKLIRGTIFLGDTKIPALFDSGATYSFISNECVEKLKLLVIELPVLMNVSTLAGASVKTIRAYLKSLRILPPIVNLEIPMFLSAMQIKRSDYEGCQMFLVFFSAFGEYDGTLDEIGVVSEFLKVFADEMSSLPLVREIEFFINLVPRTEPISRAPYWMAPSKLEELKKQLEELLEKGFIRLSVSP
ncbi:uncharacterized protein LOC129314038 [Prosopis cineraria]|uniref:uncharacterized protein LOC129314038 n=1 Tax=Prosopis cineraria TaxID=364024 RepID=UPI00240F71CC|nr:uncharacterized protein LOC129314038 [Prosopis cineraria]